MWARLKYHGPLSDATINWTITSRRFGLKFMFHPTQWTLEWSSGSSVGYFHVGPFGLYWLGPNVMREKEFHKVWREM